MTKLKYWTEEEEALLIQLKDELGYTYKQISIEIGRSAGSCNVKYNKLTNPKYLENQRKNNKKYREDNKDRVAEYHKRYYQNNRDKYLEYNKQYYQNNRDKYLEYNKQYYQNNRDKYLEYRKRYYQNNRDKYLEYNKRYYEDNLEYFKQYRENNKDKIAEYFRNYFAQNPDKNTREERYSGEFADIQLCHDFYNGISPITGTKDDLQVHHLISVKDNIGFWESATPEIKINYLILVPKDIHAAYHSWMGGTKIPSTPESFWFFIDNVFFNDQATLDSFVL